MRREPDRPRSTRPGKAPQPLTAEGLSSTRNTAEVPNRLLYPVDEVAILLGVGLTFTWQLVQEGRLRTVSLGKRRLVSRADLEAFVANLREEQPAG